MIHVIRKLFNYFLITMYLIWYLLFCKTKNPFIMRKHWMLFSYLCTERIRHFHIQIVGNFDIRQTFVSRTSTCIFRIRKNCTIQLSIIRNGEKKAFNIRRAWICIIPLHKSDARSFIGDLYDVKFSIRLKMTVSSRAAWKVSFFFWRNNCNLATKMKCITQNCRTLKLFRYVL